MQLEKNVWLKDRYQILGYIHKGGMGAVYRAHDRLDNRAVAIKLPKTAPSAEGETMTALPAGDEPLVFEIVLRKQVKGS